MRTWAGPAYVVAATVLLGGGRMFLRAGDLAPQVREAAKAITAKHLLEFTRVLASDAFEGRAPGTAGEEKTVSYLIEQFKALGLKPGNPSGSWTQDVPLVGQTTEAPAISFGIDGRSAELRFPDECVIWSKRFVPAVDVTNSEVVFVGYGVVAPEYGWDDFKGLDVHGKTLLMLINDPPVPDPVSPDRLDANMFKGRAMTYYGRWTYKFEIAAAKGAAAAIIVHEEEAAGYPWAVVVGSNSHENFDLQSPGRNLDRAAIEGWMRLDQARKLLAARTYDFDSLKRQAVSKEFRPLPLGIQANFSLKNRARDVGSRNVIGRLDGSEAKARNEYVVFTAHWDHLGRDPHLPGDPVYHGALDNASGVAALLEFARAFRALKTPPRRTVLFLSVTAEEKGLLGSKYYVEHPLYPLQRTVADFNLDGLNPWGRTRDVEVVGLGNSSLDELISEVAAQQDRIIKPDSEPERGRFYRSDHFEFAKGGVPALYLKGGVDYLGKPGDYGRRKLEEYTAHDYHKVTDTVRADWDWSGAVEDVRLLFQAGWLTAQAKKRPEWKADSEFRLKHASR